jgi:hypothetical protein
LRAAGDAKAPVIALAGVALAALAVGVVHPHFGESDEPFAGRYEEVGGTVGGILKTAVTDPLTLVRVAFDERGIGYLVRLLVPLAFLPLASPLALLPALPDLALNLLSSTRTQTSIHFHYTAPLIPAFFAAAIFTAAKLRRNVAPVLVVLMIVANFALGAIPIWAAIPGGEDLQARSALVSEHDRIAERALELIPDDAVVSASNSLGAHLSARAASSASRSETTPPGSPSTSGRPATSTGSRPGRTGSRSAACAPIRTGDSSSTPTACWCSDGNRLRQQVRREPEGETARERILLDRRKRDHPREIPRRDVGRAQEQQPRREREPSSAAPRAAQQPHVRNDERDAEERDRDVLGDAELREPGRERVARRLARVVGERTERAEPRKSVLPGRDPEHQNRRDREAEMPDSPPADPRLDRRAAGRERPEST